MKPATCTKRRLFGATTSALLTALTIMTGFGADEAHAAATAAPLSGEIEHLSLTTPGDFWSGGTIVVGGQTVIIPRNLLLDLPANRLTLWELVNQAPLACKLKGETGLAKADNCNTSGKGGFAFVAANRTAAGNVIAGDVFLEKGRESIVGTVTYINYDQGYLRINGTPVAATTTTDPGTGLLARMNDPSGRHTLQTGLGCGTSNETINGVTTSLANCSPDPRFALDSDNYTNASTTGYPMCIPSRIVRTWAGLPEQGSGADLSPAVTGGRTNSNTGVPGNGDALCPQGNRPADPNTPVLDSRRMAPIKVGDHISLEGSFETVNGVRFLSFHTSTTSTALLTSTALTQPDYIAPDEIELDAPGFNNLRIRGLFIGYSTLPPDILFWSVHYDPVHNEPHEMPLGTTKGCDTVTEAGNDCGLFNGLVPGVGNHIWKLRYFLDFEEGARARANPCIHLRADVRMGTDICPNNRSTEAAAMNEIFGILSPLPREFIMRTGHLLAAREAGFEPVTVDIRGNQATNGEYLFPVANGILGMGGLGGIGMPEMVEVDLTRTWLPFFFTSMPWTLDRRLSPGGCKGPCESTPQPLIPYPFEGLDPRTEAANIPGGAYNDPNFTASPLTEIRNRILSYVTPIPGTSPVAYNFNGDSSVLSWPPVDPSLQSITATPNTIFCAKGVQGVNTTLNSTCRATVVAPSSCTAPLVLQNGNCVRSLITVDAEPSAAPPVFPGFTGSVATPAPVAALPAKDTVSIRAVVWVPIGGNRGLRVIAKSSQPTSPTPTLVMSAFNVATPLLTNVTLTLTTTNIATDSGAITCSVADPCWQLPLTRTPRDVKPTSISVNSSKGGAAIALPTNTASF